MTGALGQSGLCPLTLEPSSARWSVAEQRVALGWAAKTRGSSMDELCTLMDESRGHHRLPGFGGARGSWPWKNLRRRRAIHAELTLADAVVPFMRLGKFRPGG